MVRFLVAPAVILAVCDAQPASAQEQPAPSRQPEAEAEAQVEPDPALAFTITGSATLASEYRFRGVSLSDGDPAVQGTINLNHESGLYAGVWASSLEGFGAVGGASAEIDLYAGYRREVASGVTVDGGLLYYLYPGAEGGEFDYFEPFANMTVTTGPVTNKVGFAYSWEQDALGGNDNLYVFNDTAFALGGTPFALLGHVGYNAGNSGLAFGSDYLDWSLGATATWRNLTLGVAYIDTDISETQAAAFGAPRRIVDDALVATLSASF